MCRLRRIGILVLVAACALAAGCDSPDGSSSSTSSRPSSPSPTKPGTIESASRTPRVIARFKPSVTQQQAEAFRSDGRTSLTIAQLGATTGMSWAKRELQVLAPAPLGDVNLARIRSFLFLSGLFETVRVTG